LHDIAIGGFIRSDHGYWTAQLLEPFDDEAPTTCPTPISRKPIGTRVGTSGT